MNRRVGNSKPITSHTFLLSDRVRGFSGVESPLAGVAATADGDVLSTEPAGIFRFTVKHRGKVQIKTLSLKERCTNIKSGKIRLLLKTHSSSLKTNRRSDFCPLAKLTPALLPFPAPPGLFIEARLHASGSCASFLVFMCPSNGRAGQVPGRWRARARG